MTINRDITTVENYNKYEWKYIVNKLNNLTNGSFNCFFHNKLMVDDNLWDEFMYLLGGQFSYMKYNDGIYKNTDFTLQWGKWSNGEISQAQGIGDLISTAGGGGGTSTGGRPGIAFFTDPFITFLKANGLLSRVKYRSRIQCFSGGSIDDCGCCGSIKVGCIELYAEGMVGC